MNSTTVARTVTVHNPCAVRTTDIDSFSVIICSLELNLFPKFWSLKWSEARWSFVSSSVCMQSRYIDELLIMNVSEQVVILAAFLWVLCVLPMILSYWHPLLLHFVFCFPSVNALPGTRNLISTHLKHNLYVSVLRKI